ncbi:beta strand repeat-containing protein [Neobacillus sp. Marseille-QA0830]
MAIQTVINTHDSGQGSLRMAVDMAGTGDTIVFAVSGTITLFSPIAISKTLSISGPGPTISGITTRIFTISGSSNQVTISGLTFQNGHDTTGNGGGAILNDAATLNVARCTFLTNTTSTSGGAIANKNSGTVNVTNSIFTENTGNFGGAIGNFTPSIVSVTNTTFTKNRAAAGTGGAIVNDGMARITNCTFTENTASDQGGAVANIGTVVIVNSRFFGSKPLNNASNGGAVANFQTGDVNIANSTFSGNQVSGNGGAISNDHSGTVMINNCIFADNSAPNSVGGAIANNNTSNDNDSALVNVSNSTFSGNIANFGGAIGNFATNTANITNSTFSNNQALNGNGGAITNDGTLMVTRSTFTNNSAPNGSFGGGAIANTKDASVIRSTFIGNTAGLNKAGAIANISPDGSITLMNNTFSGNSEPPVTGVTTIANATMI